MVEIYRIYKVTPTQIYKNEIKPQVDLKVDEVKPRLDKNGNIRKNDFIEFSIESKLLDLSERKTCSETPKKVESVV